jgi:hypothetical protein
MKTTIDMAREAGLPEAWISETGVLKWSDLARFAELVRADEREVCAKVCEEVGVWPSLGPRHCAEAIRERGNA